MDEKLKHRLIGLAVIISLGAIFAPAVMKKSSQQMDSNFSVNVKLPPKPIVPNVVITDEKDMFKTIKVAKVDISPVSKEKQLSELVNAESITGEQLNTNKNTVAERIQADVKSEQLQLALSQATKASIKHVVNVAVNKPKKAIPLVTAKAKQIAKPVQLVKRATPAKAIRVVAANKSRIKRDIYAVQLASFSQITNAKALVSRLHNRGYKASFTKTTGRQGAVYKVYAGHSPRKIDAMQLKTQLASAMRLNGFVVNTGVS